MPLDLSLRSLLTGKKQGVSTPTAFILRFLPVRWFGWGEGFTWNFQHSHSWSFNRTKIIKMKREKCETKPYLCNNPSRLILSESCHLTNSEILWLPVINLSRAWKSTYIESGDQSRILIVFELLSFFFFFNYVLRNCCSSCNIQTISPRFGEWLSIVQNRGFGGGSTILH